MLQLLEFSSLGKDLKSGGRCLKGLQSGSRRKE